MSMSMKEAYAKAQVLLGRKATVEENRRPLPTKEQRKIIAAKPWKERTKEERGMCISFKCTMGTIERIAGLGFLTVEAQGDTWEEVFEDYDRKKKAAEDRKAKERAEKDAIQANMDRQLNLRLDKAVKIAAKHNPGCPCPHCRLVRAKLPATA